MTPAKLRLAQAAMGRRETGVGELCAELGITRQTLYRHVDPEGRLRPDGEKLLSHLHAGREQGPPAGTRGTKAGERHA
jgi:DNA-binding phage protein